MNPEELYDKQKPQRQAHDREDPDDDEEEE